MQFNAARLILATVAIAVSFGTFGYLGGEGIFVSVWVGLSVALIVILIHPSQIWPVIRTVACTVIGGWVGWTFGPTIRVVAIFGTFGFVVGVLWTRFEPDDESESQ